MKHLRSTVPRYVALLALGHLGAACGISASESSDDLAQNPDELTFGSPTGEAGFPTTAWTNNNNVVPICWTTPGYSVEKANVQNSVNTAWGHSSSLQFTWTPTCPTTGTTKYLKFSISAFQPPHENDTGGQCFVGMDATFRLPSEASRCDLGAPVGADPGRISYLGVHEIGHALGMIHEQDRGENADSSLCPKRSSAVLDDRTPLTIYDQNSVMNYCQAGGNSSGAITYLDRLGISQVYNRPYVALTGAKNGSLYHRIRTTTGTTGGSWTNFLSVEAFAGEIGTIVGSDMRTTHFGMTHLAAITGDGGGLYYAARNPNGTWQGFVNVKTLAGDPGPVTRVSLAEDSSLLGPLEVNRMHLAAVTSDGRLWHAIRFEDGAWNPLTDVESFAGERGTFTDVGITVSGDELNAQELLQLCGVTSDGDVWHAVREHNGAWTPLQNLEDFTGGERGDFTDVDCVAIADSLHFVGVISTGQVYHAIRFPSGAWTNMGNVTALVGGLTGTIHKVAVGQQRGQLNVVLRNTAGTLFYGVRPGLAWTSFVTIPVTSGVGAVDSIALD